MILKGSGNYLNFDKTRVKLFPNFTRHHLITHTNLFGRYSAYQQNDVLGLQQTKKQYKPAYKHAKAPDPAL